MLFIYFSKLRIYCFSKAENYWVGVIFLKSGSREGKTFSQNIENPGGFLSVVTWRYSCCSCLLCTLDDWVPIKGLLLMESPRDEDTNLWGKHGHRDTVSFPWHTKFYRNPKLYGLPISKIKREEPKAIKWILDMQIMSHFKKTASHIHSSDTITARPLKFDPGKFGILTIFFNPLNISKFSTPS